MPTVISLHRWHLLWGVTMVLTLLVGGFYVRANLPPRPGVYWLFPYPSRETPAEWQRKAEAAPEFQEALRTANDARNAIIARGLALWVLSGVALYGIGVAAHRAVR